MDITRMQQRRGTAAEWEDLNPILADGEIGYEKDTRSMKMGDGVSVWMALPYYVNETVVDDKITAAITGEDALDETLYVKVAGAQAITGVKNFTANPTIGGVNVETTNGAQLKATTALNAAIGDAAGKYVSLAPAPRGGGLDDTANIQAAIDALPTGGAVYGGVVLLRPSNVAYLISSPLLLPNGVCLRGHGPSATNITALAGFAGTAMVKNGDTSGAQEFAWIEELTLNGNDVAACCVIFDRVYVNSGFRKMVAKNATQEGMMVKASATSAGPVYFEDVWSFAHGKECIKTSGDLRQIWFTRTTAESPGNGYAAMNISGVKNLEVTGLHIEHYEAGEQIIGMILNDVIVANIDGVFFSGYGAGALSDLVKITGTSVGIDAQRLYSGALGTNLVNDVTNGVVITVAGFNGYCSRYHTDKAVGPGASTPLPKLRTGMFYNPASAIGTQAQAAGNLTAIRYDLAPCTIIALALEVTVLAVGATVRLGIYSDGGGKPGVPLLDAGTIDASTIGVKTIAGLNFKAVGAPIWVVALIEGGAPTVKTCGTNGATLGVGYTSAATESGNSPVGYIKTGVATGALPNPFPAAFDGTAVAPRVLIGT